MGEANSGHYYSYINNRDSDDLNEWFEFNDAVVSPFDIDNLDEKAFGGVSKLVFTDENGQQETATTEKAANAYMLIYERKQMYLWEKIGNKEELIKVDEFGRLTEKVNCNPSEGNVEEYTDLLGLNDSDNENAKQEESKSFNYDFEIPQEFSNLIQSINMKKWQVKYICGEMLGCTSNYLANLEIIRFSDYDACK